MVRFVSNLKLAVFAGMIAGLLSACGSSSDNSIADLTGNHATGTDPTASPSPTATATSSPTPVPSSSQGVAVGNSLKIYKTTTTTVVGATTLSTLGQALNLRAVIVDPNGVFVKEVPANWAVLGTLIPADFNITGGNPSKYSTYTANHPAEGLIFASVDDNTVITAENLTVASAFTGDITADVVSLADQVEVFTGNNQTGIGGTTLGSQLVAKVVDSTGNALSGENVTFAVALGGGAITSSTTVATNSNGMASATVKLGPAAGANVFTASIASGSVTSVQFLATGTTPPSSLRIAAIGSTDPVGSTTLSNSGGSLALRAILVDQAGGFLKEIPAQWGVTGSLNPGDFVATGGNPSKYATYTANHPGVGILQAYVTDSTLISTNNIISATTATGTVTSTVTALPDAIEIVSGSNQVGSANAQLTTPLVARVKDNVGAPVVGVAVTFAVVSGGGSIISTATVNSDSNGLANATVKLGSAAGTNTFSATMPSGTTPSVTFTETATPQASVLKIYKTTTSLSVGVTTLTSLGQVLNLRAVLVDSTGNFIKEVAANWAISGTLIPGDFNITGGNPSKYADYTANHPGTGLVFASVNDSTVIANENITSTTAFTGTLSAAVTSPADRVDVFTGNNQAGVGGANLGSPLVVIVKDAIGNVLSGVNVTFATVSGGGSIVSSSTVATDVNGLASANVKLGLTAGNNVFSATIGSGSQTSVQFSATASAPPSSLQISLVGSTAPVSATTLSSSGGVLNLRAVLVDPNGAFLKEVAAQWSITGSLTSGDFAVTGGNPSKYSVYTANHPGAGTIQAIVTDAPTISGNNIISASTTSGTITSSVTSAPDVIEKVSGGTQVGTANSQLTNPLVVRVKDNVGTPVIGVSVTFAVASGDGSIVSTAVVNTDSNGLASATVKLGVTAGAQSFSATMSGGSISTVTFNETATTQATALKIFKTTTTTSFGATTLTTLGQALNLRAVLVNSSGDFVKEVAANWSIVGSLIPADFTVESGNPSKYADYVAGHPASGIIFAAVDDPAVIAAENITSTSAFTGTITAAVTSAADKIEIFTGNNQSGVGGATLSGPFVVNVKDSVGTLLSGVNVTFASVSGGGSVTSTTTVATDSNGAASATAKLGMSVGNDVFSATIGSGTITSVQFNAAASAPPSSVQISLVGGTLPVADTSLSSFGGSLSLRAILVDQTGAFIKEIPAQWSVTGTLNASDFAVTGVNPSKYATYTANHPGAGTVQAIVTDSAAITSNNIISATTATGTLTSSVTAAPDVIEIVSGANQLAAANSQLGSPIVARVKDNAGSPVSGVTVTFAVVSGAGSILSSTTPTSDSNGLVNAVVKLGAAAGTNSFSATMASGSTKTVSFTETATAPPSVLKIFKTTTTTAVGDTTISTLNSGLNLRAVLVDQSGALIQEIPATWSMSGTLTPSDFTITGGNPSKYGTYTAGHSGVGTIQATVDDAIAISNYNIISTTSLTGVITSSVTQMPDKVLVFSGNGQSGPRSTQLGSPLVAIVKDSNNSPLQNVNVTFAPVTGGGSIVTSQTIATDGNGLAQAIVNLGSTVGSQSYSATISSGTTTSATFTATGTASAPVLSVISGGNQYAGPGFAFTNPLVVQLTQDGSPVSGTTVYFTITSSTGATFSSPSSVSDGSGLASVNLTAGASSGAVVVRAAAGVASTTFSETIQSQTGVNLSYDSGATQSGVVGSSLATPLKVFVQDATTGNPVSNILVRFAVTAGGGTLNSSGSSVVVGTNTSGYASASLALGTTSGTQTVRASILSTPSTYYDFNETATADVFNKDQTKVTSNPTSFTADGVALATLTLTTKDQYSNSKTTSGATVAFSCTAGTLTGSVTDQGNGTYTRQLRAPNSSATPVVCSATYNGTAVTQTASIGLNAGGYDLTQSVIGLSSGSITANGSSTTLVTLTLKDSLGNVLSSGGQTVTFTSTDGTFLNSSVQDNGDGTYSRNLRSSTIAGIKTITAFVNASQVTHTQFVTFAPGAAYAPNSTLVVSPGSAVPDGVSTVAAAVTLKDLNGNQLSAGGDSVVISSTVGTWVSAIADGGNGLYTRTLRSPTGSSVAAVTATVNGVALPTLQNRTVYFTNGATGPSLTNSTVTLIGTTPIAADGSSTVVAKVSLKDASNNSLGIGGSNVVISTTAGTLLGTPTDNGDGTYSQTLRSSVTATGVVTVSATVDGNSILNTTSLSFYGAISMANSTVKAAPASLPADNTSTTVITLQAVDANGVSIPVGGASTGMSFSTNYGTLLSTITDNSNGTYTQSIRAPASANNATVSATKTSNGTTPAITVEFYANTSITTPTTIDCSTISSYNNKPLIVDGTTVTLNTRGTAAGSPCTGTFTTVIIKNGGTLTHTATGTSANVYGMEFTADNLTVDATSSINVSGKGYQNATNLNFRVPGTAYVPQSVGTGKTGAAPVNVGGTYGGEGGGSSATDYAAKTYGNLYQPIELGASGSSNTGATGGGGQIKITVTNTATINGTINGSANTSGGTTGSAGGSIWLTAGTLSGAGSISAAGATGTTSSGGGGRIAVYYTAASGNFSYPSTILANITAYGGGTTGTNGAGSAGTIYFKSATQTYGDLVINNNNIVPALARTQFNVPAIANPSAITGTQLTNTNAFVDNYTSNFAWMNYYIDPRIDQNGTPTKYDNLKYKVTGGTASTLTVTSPDNLLSVGGTGYQYEVMLVFDNVELRGRGTMAGAAKMLALSGDLNSASTNTAVATGLPLPGLEFYGAATTIDANSVGVTVPDFAIGTFGSGLTLKNGTFSFANPLTATSLTIDNSSVTMGQNKGTTSLTLTTGGLSLINNSTLTQSATSTTAGVTETSLEIAAASLNVASGSSITATGKGYLATTGSRCRVAGNSNDTGYNGANTVIASGGSYGGYGGSDVQSAGGVTNLPYGNYANPYFSGASCNPTSAGGGIVRISLGIGAAVVDGTITSNGAGAGSGGGAGGSIFLDAGAVSGAGSITANGGAGAVNTSGGSGGRVAIQYNTLAGNYALGAATFQTYVRALGGTSTYNGSMGTVYGKDKAQTYGDLYINNNGVAPNASYRVGAYIGMPSVASSVTLTSSTATIAGNFQEHAQETKYATGLYLSPKINQNATATLLDDTLYKVSDTTGSTVTVTGTGMNTVGNAGDSLLFVLALRNVEIRNNGYLVLAGPLMASSLTMDSSANYIPTILKGREAISVSGAISLTNSSNIIQDVTSTAVGGPEYSLEIDAGSLNVGAGNSIHANAKGYVSATNNKCRVLGNADSNGYNGNAGSTVNGTSSGGSHGGYGASDVQNSQGTTNLPYGSFYNPYTSGASCYPGAVGGGIVRIDLGTGAATIDGTISSNGGSNAWGAAGGSVYLSVGALSGAGSIQVNGGVSGANQGSGSGGRIAVNYSSLAGNYTLGTNAIANIKATAGLTGTYVGSAGTVFLKDKAQTYGDMVVSNGGVSANVSYRYGTYLYSPAVTTSSALSSSGITLTSGSFQEFSTDSGAAVGLYLTPNLSQNATGTLLDDTLYKITATTGAAATTSGGNMTSVASTGNTVSEVLMLRNFDIRNNAFMAVDMPVVATNLTLDSNAGFTPNILKGRRAISLSGALTVTNASNLIQTLTSTTVGGAEYALEIDAGSLSVGTGSSINANAKGYTSATNYKCRVLGNVDSNGYSGSAGTTVNGTSSGGSHGGYGASDVQNSQGTTNLPYGSFYNPYTSGASCYPGATGGGIVRIDLGTGAATVDGTISSNGGSNAWGAAGGSVYLNVGTLSGAGSIQSNGGVSGANQGSGSGGRIAVNYSTLAGNYTLGTNAIANIKATAGLTGTYVGSAGTVFLKDKAQTYGDMVVSNGGVNANTSYRYGTYLYSPGLVTSSALSSGSISMSAGSFQEYSTDSGAAVGLYLTPNTAQNATASYLDDSLYQITATTGATATTTGGNMTSVASTGNTLSEILVLRNFDIRNNAYLALDMPVVATNMTLDTSATFTPNMVKGRRALSLSGTLTVTNASNLVQAATSSTAGAAEYALDMDVAGLNIGTGSSINANGKGYVSTTAYKCRVLGNADSYGFGGTAGSNANGTASAGSHGGWGGSDVVWWGGVTNTPYGSFSNPYTSGASCYQGTVGGGIIRIDLGTGSATVDGTISSNGTSSNAGAAGGSVNITVGTLGGVGSIQAIGGAGANNYGSGGGGRIAVTYASLTGNYSLGTNAVANFRANSAASPNVTGSAGTIYLKDKAQTYGDMIINNFGTSAQASYKTGAYIGIPAITNSTALTSTSVTLSSGTFQEFAQDTGALVGLYLTPNMPTTPATWIGSNLFQISSTTGASATVSAGDMTSVASVGNNVGYILGLRNLDVRNNATFDLPVSIMATGNVTVDSNAILNSNTIRNRRFMSVGGTLTVSNSASITQAQTASTVNGTEYAIDIDAGNLSVLTAGQITASAKGFNATTANKCRVVGNSDVLSFGGGNGTNSAGSHGGFGGSDVVWWAGATNMPYGSFSNPNTSGGSCVSGAVGGGIIRLDIGSGTTTIDGTISTNGGASNAGAAGGSVYINTGTLGGLGNIQAIGGAAANNYGGGGGGRIAVNYSTLAGNYTLGTNAIANFRANGGTSPNINGSAGTIFLKDKGQTYGDMIINNAGIASNLTYRMGAYIGAPGATTSSALTATGITLSGGTFQEFSQDTGASVGLYLTPNIPSTALSWLSATLLPIISTNLGSATISGGNLTSLGAVGNTATPVLALRNLDIRNYGIFDNQIPIVATGYVTIDGTGSNINSNILRTRRFMSVGGALTVSNSGNMTHAATSSTAGGAEYALDIDAGSLNVLSAATINVSTKGYNGTTAGRCRVAGNTDALGYAAGNGTNCGGSYGGYGGSDSVWWLGTTNAPYGSFYAPYHSGGSCYSGAVGGGIIKIDVGSGAAVIDGQLISNGGTANQGAAGGSIQLIAGAVSGAGSMSANGGGANNNYGGGSGGRIAIQYTSVAGNFSGVGAVTYLKAYGGTSPNINGSPGTIFLKDKAQTYGDLIVTNNNVLPNASFRAGASVGIPANANSSALSTNVLTGPVSTFLENGQDTGYPIGLVVNPNTGQNATATYADDTVYGIASNTSNTVTTSTSGMTVTGASGNPYSFYSIFNHVELGSKGALYLNGPMLVNSGDLTNGTGTLGLNGAINNQNFFEFGSGVANLKLTNFTGTFTKPFTGTSLYIDTSNVTFSIPKGTQAINLSGALTLINNSNLYQDFTSSSIGGAEYALDIACGSLVVNSGSAISSNGRGYVATTAGYFRSLGNQDVLSVYGASPNNSGASHGGFGGVLTNNPTYDCNMPYGNFYYPYTSGSSWGSTARGGGIIKINVGSGTGTATVDGTIDSGSNNGAAAGSIQLLTGTLQGVGKIKAVGSVSANSSGSGGRIAIHYATSMLGNYSYPSNVIANIQAYGGAGAAVASPGTVFVKNTSLTYGDLIVNNNGSAPNGYGAATTRSGAYIGMPTSANSNALTSTTISTGSTYQEMSQNSLYPVGLFVDPNTTTSGQTLLTNDSLFMITSVSGGVATTAGNMTSGASVGNPVTYGLVLNNLEVSGLGTLYMSGPIAVLNGDISSNNTTTFNMNGAISNGGAFPLETSGITNSTLTGVTATMPYLNAAGNLTVTGTSAVTLTSPSTVSGALTVSSSSNLYTGTTGLTPSLTVTGNTTLSSSSFIRSVPSTTAGVSRLYLSTANLTIDSTSGISGLNGGYRSVTQQFRGPGNQLYNNRSNTTNNAGGGSYGGLGGYANSHDRNDTYGNFAWPIESGSSDGWNAGGVGGGAVQIDVTGTLSNDGLITSPGTIGATYSGAGGSVLIHAPTISGLGSISAPGGASGASGGGGRVAIYFTTGSNNFAYPSGMVANVTAYGGNGGTAQASGGSGTVYLKQPGQTYGDLIINGGNVANTLNSTYIRAVTTGLFSDSVTATTLTKAGNFGYAASVPNNYPINDKWLGYCINPNTGQNATQKNSDDQLYLIRGSTGSSVTVGNAFNMTTLPAAASNPYKVVMCLDHLEVRAKGSLDITGMDVRVMSGDVSSGTGVNFIQDGIIKAGIVDVSASVNWNDSTYSGDNAGTSVTAQCASNKSACP